MYWDNRVSYSGLWSYCNGNFTVQFPPWVVASVNTFKTNAIDHWSNDQLLEWGAWFLPLSVHKQTTMPAQHKIFQRTTNKVFCLQMKLEFTFSFSLFRILKHQSLIATKTRQITVWLHSVDRWSKQIEGRWNSSSWPWEQDIYKTYQISISETVQSSTALLCSYMKLTHPQNPNSTKMYPADLSE